MSLGKNIRELRKVRGLTQEELGKALDMSSQTVSKWERDESMPDAALLPRLADILETSLDRLFDRRVTQFGDAARAAKDWLLTLAGGERWLGALRLGRILQTVLCGFWETETPGLPLTVEDFDSPESLTGFCAGDEGISFSSRRASLPYLVLLPEPETGWGPLLAEEDPACWEALGRSPVREALRQFCAGELPRCFDGSWAKAKGEALSPETLAGLEALGALKRQPARIDGRETELYLWSYPPQLLALLLLGGVKAVNDRGFGCASRRSPLLRKREKGEEE